MPLAPVRNAHGIAESPNGKPWEGALDRKPWEHWVTAAIVHLDTPDLLEAVVATLRAQTERPYIIVVDVGSLDRHRPSLERLRRESDDLEVHYLNPLGWQYTSQPVTTAMDLAMALCQTEYLYATHTDVFLKRPDYLRWLVSLCGCRTPAVGYQMSPRPWARPHSELWRRIVSHTATLYHMPTLRRIGARWDLLGSIERLGVRLGETNNGWPDTEVGVSLALHEAGIGERWLTDPPPAGNDPPSVLLIGTEPNDPYEDDNLVHMRSTTIHRLYDSPTSRKHAAKLNAERDAAIERARQWELERNGGG